MKFTAAIAVLCASIVAVSAETNAERMARGLPPKAPSRRGTPIVAARHNEPSSTPNPCHNGSLQCCDSVTQCNDDIRHWIKGLLGIDVDQGTSIGFSCEPLTSAGLNHGTCKHKAVCCKSVYFNGRVAIGCSPVS